MSMPHLRVLFLSMLLVMSSQAAQAVNYYWRGNDPVNPSRWDMGSNWGGGVVPGPADHALVHNFGTSQRAMPIIDSEVPALQYLTIAWHPVDASLTVEAGARIDTYNLYMGYGAGVDSRGVLTVNGGQIYAEYLRVGVDGHGELYLNGGLIETMTMTVGPEYDTGTGNIDLAGGTLIVATDVRDRVAQWIANGWLTAYGGAGRVVYDYSGTHAGRTTVRGIPLDQAYGPSPSDGAVIGSGSAASLLLAWNAGDGATEHDLYFGDDPGAVQTAGTADDYYVGRFSATAYTVENLAPGATYYWRVDEVTGSGVVPGQVWSFRVGQAQAHDLYSDTWVATDALGRSLPGRAECGPPRPDRIVGMYYVLWHGYHTTPGPYNVTEIVNANPSNPAFVPNQPHFWDEPEAGFYLADDRWMHRRNISMLTEAGVDVIIIESTNGFPYVRAAMTLIEELQAMKADGYDTPLTFCFWTHAHSPGTIKTYYDEIYSQGLFEDLWFMWDGKPLMLGYPDGLPTDVNQHSVSQEIRDFFTWRECWAWDHGQDKWQFVDVTPQDWSWSDSPDRPEQVVVAAASHATNNVGKSNIGGVQPPRDEYDLPVGGTEGHGLYFAEQYERARLLDPEFLFLTEWNEWIAGAFVRNEGDPQFHFMGEPVDVGEIFFVDQYNREFNRDLAPMRGGYTDNYYYQMTDFIRRYKGVRNLPVAGGAASVSIDGNFDDWTQVTPAFRDTPGDTYHRRHLGWGTVGVLENTTGRNDFVLTKVARDEDYLYFYAETAEDLTAHTDPHWMLLFIDADQDNSTGWEGYDFVVNHGGLGASTTTLKQNAGGWSWTVVDDAIPYAVSGNQLELRIPRTALGQGTGDAPVALDFHWADNIQQEDDIIEFAVSGDSAPNRRFNYRYTTSREEEIVLVEEDFDAPDSAPWGDWDISSAEAYTGTHSLECSEEDTAGLVVGIDTSGLSSFRVSFHYKIHGADPDDEVALFYHDGTAWNYVTDLAAHENDVWLNYTEVRYNDGADARFFVPNLTFHVQGGSLDSGEYCWIDNVLITGMREATAASGPYPPDGATDVEVTTHLGWTAGTGATAHDIHFGLTAPGTAQGTVTGSERFDPGALQYATTYYWRVDEQTAGGTVTGDVWSFTTGDDRLDPELIKQTALELLDHFGALDANASAGLDYDEALAQIPDLAFESFDSIDEDGDGELRQDELRAAAGLPPVPWGSALTLGVVLAAAAVWVIGRRRFNVTN